jgi:hypothetical protein
MQLSLDSARSVVRVHTSADGLLARLAHDLELLCGGITGAAVRGAGDVTKVSLEIPIDSVSVAGVRKKDGTLDERALRPDEQRDLLVKMKADVFHVGSGAVVRVEADYEAAGEVRVRIVPPRHAGHPITVTRPRVSEQADGSVSAEGKFEISLAKLGSNVVKGPMGAFRVSDLVTLLYALVFVPDRA